MLTLVLLALAVGMLAAFLVTAAESSVLRAFGIETGFRLAEMHHGYLGVLLVVAGCWLGIAWQLGGLVLLADDLYQHWRQTWYSEPAYRSPLHQLFGATVWKWRWVQRLTRWLDGVFG